MYRFLYCFFKNLQILLIYELIIYISLNRITDRMHRLMRHAFEMCRIAIHE